jgi:hypothetical protein
MFVEPGNNSMRVALLDPVDARRTQSIAFKSIEEVAKQAEWKRHVDRYMCGREVGAEEEWIRVTNNPSPSLL